MQTLTHSEAGAVEAAGGIERHSIDRIPLAERHGKPSGVGAIWFMGNMNFTAMASGAVVITFGTSLFWTCVATVLGSLFGTFFMAFHSAQGPQLGLPQLVQSRPQFGYVGAALTVWVFTLVNYVGFNTSDAIMAGSSMHNLVDMGDKLGYVLAAAVATVIALYGYDWIHRVNRWLAWPFVLLMAVVTVAALTSHALPAGVWIPGKFDLAPFMLVFVFMAGFQLGWAPYVSDYSRYLRPDVKVRTTFWWTYLPSALSGIWVFVLGSVVAAADPNDDPVTALKVVADHVFHGFGTLAVAVLFIGLLAIMAVNQYGGSLTMISIADSVRPVKPTRAVRAVTIGIMLVSVGTISTLVGTQQFNTFFTDVVLILTYLFTPWTAINLVDFYVVRRGQYVIAEIFNPRGIYGRWGWRGNLAYLIGLGTMIPFIASTPFTGPIAKALDGVDCSIFIGLPVSGLLYWVFCRSLDLARERELVREEGILTAEH